ncbi:MAG: serine hydrolase [Rhodobacteraceae bacterium]|nr:serine hydrolase [Paracoccaceae bacterium]
MRSFDGFVGRLAGLAVGSVLAFGGAALAEDAQPVPVNMHPKLTREAVDNAVAELDAMATEAASRGTVPGLAIAVVFEGETIWARGYGVREVGQDARVDADTVFQLASVSKPVGATVVAALVGKRRITWDSRIGELDPGFALSAPWISDQVTIRDLYAHRSGLPDHAGDILEDMGYPREEVLRRLRFLEPSSSFRSGYDYTNFGLTEAAVAAASAYGLEWADASEEFLYGPLGMASTSSRYADFEARANKAAGHVMEDGRWVHGAQRQPDAQSPAGGVSSSVNDMAKWLRLQLDGGIYEGERIVPADALTEAHLPHMLTEPHTPFGYPGFYGLGWNVGFLPDGRAKLSHSGAFAMGAATAISVFPDDGLAIVVLTNAAPIGLPEALAATFADIAFYGHATEDWLPLYAGLFRKMAEAEVGPDLSHPPADAVPPAALDAYVGNYVNDFFGSVEIARNGDGLAMVVGPRSLTFPLTHYDRDLFTWETTGENAIGTSSVVFTLDQDRRATGMIVGQFDAFGDGRFTRE